MRSLRTLAGLAALLGATLPFTAGPSIADALDGFSAPVRTTASVGIWMAWGLGMLAAAVPHPAALTTLRVLAPAGLAATALLRGADDMWMLGVAATGAVTALAFAPSVGLRAVNGLAYPNERRFLLRPPGAVLIGPIALAWALAIAGIAAGPMLLAARVWVAGAIATLSGGALAALLLRALHGLSRRWVVFVPAGVVLHDLMVLSDPVLFVRAKVERLGPAPAGTDALDLTERAPGLAMEIRLREPTAVPVARAKDRLKATAVLCTPTRPGAVLAEAEKRRLPT